MQQADDVSLYAREDRPRIHGVRSLMSYSSTQCIYVLGVPRVFSQLTQIDV